MLLLVLSDESKKHHSPNFNKSVVGFPYERKVAALLLHEGLTEAFKLNLAGRVDYGDLMGFNVQDNPV